MGLWLASVCIRNRGMLHPSIPVAREQIHDAPQHQARHNGHQRGHEQLAAVLAAVISPALAGEQIKPFVRLLFFPE